MIKKCQGRTVVLFLINERQKRIQMMDSGNEFIQAGFCKVQYFAFFIFL